MWKRIMSLFVAVIIFMSLFLLGGCFKEEDEGPIPGDKLPLGKFDPPVKITYCKIMNNQFLSDLASLGYTETDNMWTRAYKDELGIELELAFGGVDGQSYIQQLTGAIFSESVPDFMTLSSGDFAYSMLKSLNEANLLADLSQIYIDYASEDLKRYVDLAGKEIFMPCTFDGKLKGIPQIIGSDIESFSYYWIRKDWLEALSLDIPETMDDFIDVVKQFTEGDPDSDGINNTYGLALGYDFETSLGLFFSSYGSHPKTWIEDENGKLVYGSNTQETKTALQKLAELYKGGYLTQSPENFDWVSAHNELNAGKAGIVCSKVHGGLLFNQGIIKNPSADFVPIYGFSATDKPLKVTAPLNSNGYYAIGRKCKHPEVGIKMWNLMVKFREDPSLDTYNKYLDTQDGKSIWQIALIDTSIPGKNLIQAKGVANAIKNGTVPERGNEITVYNYVMKWVNDKDPNYWGWNALFGENGSELMPEKYINENAYLISGFNAATTESMNLYKETLDELEFNTFMSILKGEKPIDYFDAYVNQWMESGGREITEEVNRWRDSYVDFRDALANSN